jgi:four helix bundle protein
LENWYGLCQHLNAVSVQSDALKRRTMAFAVAVLRLIDKLPSTAAGHVTARQVAKSATSVASNYRAACICRSRAEFIAKLGIVLEETDETEYWLDLIARAGLLRDADVRPLAQEARELRAIFGRSVATARANYQRQNRSAQSPDNQITR